MNPRIDINDPRLIDFVLGELDAAETAELEKALQLPENRDALRETEALRAAMQISEEALKTEPVPEMQELSRNRRQAILEEARLLDSPRETPARSWATRLLATAAILLLCAGAGWFVVREMQPRVVDVVASNSASSREEMKEAGQPQPVETAPVAQVNVDAPETVQEVSSAVAAPVADTLAQSRQEPEPVPETEEKAAPAVEPAPAPETETAAAEPPAPEPSLPVVQETAPEPQEMAVEAPVSEPAPVPEAVAKEAPLPEPAPMPEAAAVAAPVPEPVPEPEAIVAEEPNASPEPAPEPPAQQEQKSKETADNELVPIQTDIPEPFFGGTPLDYWSPNLEPEDYRDPPYARPREDADGIPPRSQMTQTGEDESRIQAQPAPEPEKAASKEQAPSDISALRNLGYIATESADAMPESPKGGNARGVSRSRRRDIAAPLGSLGSRRNEDLEVEGLQQDVHITQGTRLNVKKTEKQDVPLQAYIVPSPPMPYPGGESYAAIEEQPFVSADAEPLSTFSLHPDTAAYTNIKRFLENGQRPPADAVRIEEMINYFKYHYPRPTGKHPFSVNIEVGSCPWAPGHLLAKIGLQGREVPREERPAANLVFLVDTSGSMEGPSRLPLVKESLKALVKMLQPEDRVGIVTYAGESRTALKSTPVSKRDRILEAIEALSAGGSTHGSAGIEDAYDLAEKHLEGGGINRVILATDGDFNVGVTSREGLLSLIEKKRESGIFLTVLGFGMGNLKDANLETLATKGNGNYAYIDSYGEARRVLVEEVSGTLMTIAKDAKIQVEFNPALVRSYRLIGFENRQLAHRDFNDDAKDAGELGAGHPVTALYQIVPVGAPVEPGVDPLRYREEEGKEAVPAPGNSGELMFVKLRYKAPDSDTSDLIEVPVPAAAVSPEASTDDFRFVAAVAGFGLLLRDSGHKGALTYDMVRELADGALEGDHNREEFLDLVVTAKTLSGS